MLRRVDQRANQRVLRLLVQERVGRRIEEREPRTRLRHEPGYHVVLPCTHPVSRRERRRVSRHTHEDRQHGTRRLERRAEKRLPHSFRRRAHTQVRSVERHDAVWRLGRQVARDQVRRHEQSTVGQVAGS